LLDAAHTVLCPASRIPGRCAPNLTQLGPTYAALNEKLKAAPKPWPVLAEDDDVILLALPMIADDVGIGHLVLVHPAGFYWPRFRQLAWHALLITGWCCPCCCRSIGTGAGAWPSRSSDWRSAWMPWASSIREPSPSDDYPYRDELGRLFQAYDRMQLEMTEKAALEQRMVKADRLAALGRLAAGIAHEINNPLGGLMTSLDTVKLHAAPDPVLDRFLPYLERGLAQIRDIVAALLVETKARSRPLAAQDIDDVRTLLAQEAKKRDVDWIWDNRAGDASGLPATLVRQVLINLVLNALQAAGGGGHVLVRCVGAETGLEAGNRKRWRRHPGRIDETPVRALHRPERGGSWPGPLGDPSDRRATGGGIEVESRDGRTRFSVELPKGDCAWQPSASV
jgi:signal transduction histidine kinase